MNTITHKLDDYQLSVNTSNPINDDKDQAKANHAPNQCNGNGVAPLHYHCPCLCQGFDFSQPHPTQVEEEVLVFT